MFPPPSSLHKNESGIRRVIEAYAKHLPGYGVQIVEDQHSHYDLVAIHAGTARAEWDKPIVAHLHGLYWSADYPVDKNCLYANQYIVDTLRRAKTITVPSKWVAETIQRDVRVDPHVVPHGIDWHDWQHDYDHQNYVLWNKNRKYDVCDPYAVGILAEAYPKMGFITTFAPDKEYGNVVEIGIIPHKDMQRAVQHACVYLSTAKETFGIGILEAMASGVPVLGFAHGGNLDLVQHGVTGYLAKPDDYDDLKQGLAYCAKYRKQLSDNARILSKTYTWQKACELLAQIYQQAVVEREPTVTVVIPTYNYGTKDKLGRAIESALSQTVQCDITVVDDGSDDEGATHRLVEAYQKETDRIIYIRQDNSGVAHARNRGIAHSRSKYIVCLDADDAIDPKFVETCSKALEQDSSLGIAYTGLTYIKPNGETGISKWPGEFDYDKQLQRQNQIPTCCMFRRSMWERLGGYKQRYAPNGAGSEDAEFWLRAGAYGYNAKKVNKQGLFIYSWQSGRVSGDKEYQEVDWTALHPWVNDNQHPFISLAAPNNKISHLVRQYDEPKISVVIPVGVGHELEVANALDSLESQTFRRWEVILAWDAGDYEKGLYVDSERSSALKTRYPYIRTVDCGRKKGAGHARNQGAKIARSHLLLFLDADDWLYPEALQTMYDAWNETGSVIYSDYVGKSSMSGEDAKKLKDRLLHYNEKKQEAVVKFYGADYDCNRAVVQPDDTFFIWCLISSLVPKKWHNEIGGFDEQMPSWEDWDYWIRMARAGKCFTRVAKELIVYRFNTGERRLTGMQQHESLVKYMHGKYKGVNVMPCSGCGGKSRYNYKTASSSKAIIGNPNKDKGVANLMKENDEQFVLVKYDHPNRGQHKCVGGATQNYYGHRSGGEIFYVHVDDIKAQPHIYKPIKESVEERIEVEEAKPTPPPKPVEQAEPVSVEEQVRANIHLMPGITSDIMQQLKELGADTPEKIAALSEETLIEIKGVGKSRAKAILHYAKEIVEQEQKETSDD